MPRSEILATPFGRLAGMYNGQAFVIEDDGVRFFEEELVDLPGREGDSFGEPITDPNEIDERLNPTEEEG